MASSSGCNTYSVLYYGLHLPATPDELQAGVEAARRGRGRPAGSGTKEQVAIRLDRTVLAALRASGPGWQTRVSDAVGKLVKSGQL